MILTYYGCCSCWRCRSSAWPHVRWPCWRRCGSWPRRSSRTGFDRTFPRAGSTVRRGGSSWTRRSAVRADLHRLLPGRAVAGLPPRRDGARPTRPLYTSYGDPARHLQGRRSSRSAPPWCRDALTGRTDVGRALLTDPPASDASSAGLLDRIPPGCRARHPQAGRGSGCWSSRRTPPPRSTWPRHRLRAGRDRPRPAAGRPDVRVATRAVALFFGAGTMTLTLYSLHVVMRSRELLPDSHA